MKIIRYIFIVLLVAVSLFIIFLVFTFFIDYKSPKQQIIAKNNCETLICDTFSILSWNIGYAGLDASMDFFYEGGERSRQSEEKTIENLQKICRFIKNNDSVNFILLQEVDINSRRSYNINEFEKIESSLTSFSSYFSINYDADFVPLPIFKPTGKVLSSLAFCTKNKVCELTHYAYPNKMKLPMRAFLYDRCFIAARYSLQNGRQLVIINTHKSAFDNGLQRVAEMDFLKQFITDEYNRGNYVIVGGDWNQNPPFCSEKSKETEHFTAIKISEDFLPADWHWCVGNIATNRYLDKPYIKGNSTTTTLDFFLASPNVECVEINVVDLQFANSDHNPLIARFRLK
jgi:endonuclease/exonuclease/phosphatase family metal-dependent hydrolase